MKKLIKKSIQIFLLYLAKIYILRTKPTTIVITGSSNRLTFKNVIISKFLAGDSVRVSPDNHNAEFGLPLSILGLKIRKKDDWLVLIPRAIFVALFGQRVAKIFLELAINHQGDIDYVLKIFRPDVVVLTNILPVYMENFGTLDNIAIEYKKLIQNIQKGGSCLLNFDDNRLRDISKSARGKLYTFSIHNLSDYQAKNIIPTTSGSTFVLNNENFTSNILGEHYILAEISAYILKKILNN
jgi:UDP-N-acetylmuramoyl-tripeptide--D-alanyl-D-alanine ligase